MSPKFPRWIELLLRLRFRRSADYVLGDLMEEFHAGKRSRAWLLQQAFSMFWPQKESRLAEPENRGSSLFSFWSDVRYSARTLRKNPSFTAIAVLALALGIGLNTGIFSVINGIALRPLPVPGSAHMIGMFQFNRGLKNTHVHESPNYFSWQEYQRYRDDNHVFSGLLAYDPFLPATLGGDRPQQLMGQLASCNYFDVLQEPPVLGRSFSASDCAVVGEGRVVVLSHDFWRSKFASDPAIVGRKIVLDRQPFTVIGIAPPGFRGTEPFECAFWAPITVQPVLGRGFNMVTTENTFWLALLGRSKPHVSKQQVLADLAVIAGRIDQLSPPRKTAIQIRTATLLSRPEERTFVVTIGMVLLAAVGMVLLIACANVANLLLARATGRRKEIAIRLSVGASRGRLIRQLLTESLMLALLGGALGSLIAVWSSDGLFQFVIAHLPRQFSLIAVHVGPDFRILGFSLALTLLTGIVFGMAPALQASRPDMNAALKDSGAGVPTGSGGFLRHALVGAQVAVCMVLLIAAGLLLRGLYVAQTIDPGFRMEGISGVGFDLRGQGYDDRRATLFQQNLLRRLAAVPGVDAVAQAGSIPLSNDHSGASFSIPGQPGERGVEYNQVSPGFFSMLGIPIVRGRNFTEAETRTGAAVAILTESTARRLWPNQDPVGKLIRWEGGLDVEVVGVAADAQVSHLAKSDDTYAYIPAAPKEQIYLNVLVHSSNDFGSLAKEIRAALHGIDPDFVADVTRVQDNLDFWRMPSRIVAILAGSLGALGMLLACIGVYGVVSYAVGRRVREIGIRMTLGADARDVRTLILRQAMLPVVAGGLVGIAGCAAVSQILSGMLFGVSAHDPLALVTVPRLLFSIAHSACYSPGRIATKVDPIVALRYE